MQITLEISEEFVARATSLGLTPEAYARELLSDDQSIESSWEVEALRRAGAIDAGRAQVVSWEQIESRLRSRIAG